MRPTNVTFIGAGNLAWHLAPALDNTDFAVREVYSRDPRHAAALVEKLYEADAKATLDLSGSASRIFVIAITDDAIREVVQEMVLPNDAILVHTSGSQPLSILGYAATPHTGVFYPLQTFTRGKKVDFGETPIFTESDDTETGKVLVAMAKAISKKVFRISSDDRKALHIAAVFASNFSNHMLSIAHDLLANHALSFDLLKPLISETITKSFALGPEQAQTGPARRGDLEILDKHMEFLRDDEAVAEIYKVVSQHIVDAYQG